MATINKRTQFIVRWSPLLFAATTAWSILAWRHKPESLAYFSMCVAVGLFCGALIILDLLKDVSLLVLWFALLVSLAAPMFMAAFLHADFDGKTMSYRPGQLSVRRLHSSEENMAIESSPRTVFTTVVGSR